MKRVEHIGIAVKNLDESVKLYSKILNIQPYKRETIEREGVNVVFFKAGETKIELLESISSDGTIRKFIEKKGEGIHHIAIEVEDILNEINRLKRLGFTVINSEPQRGADNKLVCFLHPKETGKVLIELCQTISKDKAV